MQDKSTSVMFVEVEGVPERVLLESELTSVSEIQRFVGQLDQSAISIVALRTLDYSLCIAGGNGDFILTLARYDGESWSHWSDRGHSAPAPAKTVFVAGDAGQFSPEEVASFEEAVGLCVLFRSGDVDGMMSSFKSDRVD